MPPRPEDVWDDGDVWTGIACQQERRKRQNRLHQRAYRKKRHLKRMGLDTTPANESVTDANDIPEPTPTKIQNSSQALALKDHQSLLRVVRCHDIHEKVVNFLQKATSDWGVGSFILTDLPVLTRLNSMDALLRNGVILNIPVELLDSDDGPSLFCQQEPLAAEPQLKPPPHLSPTALQRSVMHHPWLDLFPMPRFRDNMLQGIDAGELDEEELSQKIICDLLNFDATSGASLMIWGNSWDVRGWEFSPDFFVKWASLLSGCDEILQATNYWRARRGEEPLSLTFV